MKSFIVLAVVQLALAAPQLIPNATLNCECNIPACPVDEPQRCLCENQAALECWEYQTIGGQNCPSPTPRVCTSAVNSNTTVWPEIPRPTPKCECEQKYCLQSWPESCYCSNQNKLDCYNKCGGVYPDLQSCPTTINSRASFPSAIPSPEVPTYPLNSTPTTPLGLLPSNPLTALPPANSDYAYPCNIVDLGYDPCAGVGNYHCLAYEAEIECKPSGCGVYCINENNPMTMIIDLFFPVVTSSSSSSNGDGISTDYTTSTSTSTSIRTSMSEASFLAPEALTAATTADTTTETLPTSFPTVFPTPDTFTPFAGLPSAFRSPYRHPWAALPVLPLETPGVPVQTPEIPVQTPEPPVQTPDISEFLQESPDSSTESTDSQDLFE